MNACQNCGNAARRKWCAECRPAGNRLACRSWYARHRGEVIARTLARQAARADELKEARRKRAGTDRARTVNRRGTLRKYGLTEADWNRMHADQGGCCAICRRPETRAIRGKALPLSIDHDHETGEVRGLLCARCNSTLAFIETRELLDAALSYLRSRSGRLSEVA